MFATSLTGRREASGSSFRLLVLPALTAALFANTLLYVLGSALGVFAAVVAVPPSGGPIRLSSVLTLTVVGVVAGVAAGAASRRWARHPSAAFRRVILVGLLLSLGGPMLIPDAPAGLIVTLVLRHLVVAVTTLAAGLRALPG